MPCPLSIFDIPHIVESIGSCLGRKDLVACTLINKASSEFFRRLLWRELVFKPLSVLDPMTEPSHSKALLNNLQWTRSLTIDTSNRSDILPLVSRTCTRLQHLKTLVALSMNDCNSTDVPPVLSLVANNPGLLSWSMYSEVAPSINFMMKMPLVIAKSPCLTELELEFRLCPRRGWLRYALQNLPQSLKTLTLRWKNFRRSSEPMVLVDQEWPQCYPNMETADFSIELGVGEEVAICHFLERCPELKSLTYPPMASTHIINPIAELGAKLSNLTTLYLGWLNKITESQWKGLVMAMKGRIRNFSTDAGFNTPSTKFVPDITTHWADTLESLRFLHFSHMYSHDVQRILTTCAKLKSLDCMWTLEEEAVQGTSGGTETEDWVCLDLEELHLMFADNRKVNLQEPEVSLQEIRAARRIQRIYEQLGHLVKLKELTIGWRTTNVFSECANLDMSLASGLGHLAGLKALQALDVSSIRKVKIENDEVEWMLEHWPQLKEIYGLRSRFFSRGKRDPMPGYIASLCSGRPNLIIQ